MGSRPRRRTGALPPAAPLPAPAAPPLALPAPPLAALTPAETGVDEPLRG
jgi:hypothetical protein